MNRPRASSVLFVWSYLAFVGNLALTYHWLPERIASHFDAAGHANGWMLRQHYIWFISVVVLILPAFMVGLFYGLRFLPASAINLPHRDYWLAPVRRENTFGFLFRAGVWLASFEVLFLLGIHLLVVCANSSSPARLSSAVWLLGGLLLVIVGGGLFRFVRHFYLLN